MGLTKKSDTKSATAASAKKAKAKHDAKDDNTAKAKKATGGFDEIESLFAEKKKHKQEVAKQQQEEAVQKKKEKKKHFAQQSHPPRQSISTTDWVDDGLGGKYNSEGYTGRVEDGMKIFKTHLLQSSKSGSTPDCPFDCDCCFI